MITSIIDEERQPVTIATLKTCKKNDKAIGSRGFQSAPVNRQQNTHAGLGSKQARTHAQASKRISVGVLVGGGVNSASGGPKQRRIEAGLCKPIA